MKEVYVFLADGFEEIEALTPVDYFRRAGSNVTTFSIKNQNVTGSHSITVIADKIFSENIPLPDCIVLPGGMPGAKNLSDDEHLISFIKKCYSQNKIVGALCAAPVVILAKTGLLSNHSFTCYPGMQNELHTYCNDATLFEKNVYISNAPFVTDGNLVTGRGPGCAEQFSMELIRLVMGREIAEKIRTQSVQR